MGEHIFHREQGAGAVCFEARTHLLCWANFPYNILTIQKENSTVRNSS